MLLGGLALGTSSHFGVLQRARRFPFQIGEVCLAGFACPSVPTLVHNPSLFHARMAPCALSKRIGSPPKACLRCHREYSEVLKNGDFNDRGHANGKSVKHEVKHVFGAAKAVSETSRDLSFLPLRTERTALLARRSRSRVHHLLQNN